MQKTCKAKNIEKHPTVQKFIHAIMTQDVELVKSCLVKKGRFNIQDKKLKTQDRKIRGFMNWFGPRLKNSKIQHIKFDQCLHCKIGNTVIIINNGGFPREIKDRSERSKTGLMIEIEDDLISTIQFCYVFLKTENKYKFEIDVRKLSNSGVYDDFFAAIKKQNNEDNGEN
jgi:hypothetical protein